ncbi:hypothetical protein E2562_027608 [Oryza meyeriana var. granulata]|uniref:DYW domain-containing protein n=1 Tax=Oryza meyeriana var. granulata TaxID=110450 RepID=A0A6G1DPQ9_9ORYZ|nr:hypothetical protein E2562_027608 [Oryza meyeriana var. granulata]
MLAARGLRPLEAAARRLARQGFVAPLRAASGMAPQGASARFHDYDAAITACVERRALREGRQVHARMITARHRPPVFLATRMVTMYVQCGALEDARNVFDRMPERSVVSWTAMISGYSQTERRVEALELFIEMLRAGCNPNEFTLATKLLEMEPENAGNYVILSNIYAAAGMWKDVFRVRKLMLEKTVTKEPGQSWIILDKVIHTFHSSERFHPSKKDLDAKIKEIFVDIKAAGFVPDLSCVLHDVDDEQKERMLLGHSEKLAITFGLMNTPPGLTIRNGLDLT